MNRRSFIKRSLFTLAATGMVPSLFSRTALAAGGNGKILVIYHLFGGNDALNTLIPTDADTYATYTSYRPDIAIPKANIIDLGAGQNLGLHPAMRPMADDLWDDGQLALVSLVGYPNHNRSHFYSTAVWNTADPNHPNAYGWLGKFIDEKNDPFCATNFGPNLPRALRGVHTSGLSIESIGGFGLGTRGWEQKLQTELLRQIQYSRNGTAEEVRGAMEHMLRSVEKVRGAQDEAFAPSTNFPDNTYGKRFRDIARLIKYEFPSQVYYASTGGFDTHANQGDASNDSYHAGILGDLSSALVAFKREMIAQNRWNDVMVMIFSEFGRRVEQNASAGTDHGKGGVLFVTGGGVRGGIYGEKPVLDEEALDHGDLPVKVDFRSVYADGARFIGADPAELVGAEFSPIGLI